MSEIARGYVHAIMIAFCKKDRAYGSQSLRAKNSHIYGLRVATLSCSHLHG